MMPSGFGRQGEGRRGRWGDGVVLVKDLVYFFFGLLCFSTHRY